jgi:hypothetical protein
MFIFEKVGHSKFVEMHGDISDYFRSASKSNGPFWLWDETSCSVDTDSHKLKQLKVKIVIIICQTSNQSATMEQNYCSSKSIKWTTRKKYVLQESLFSFFFSVR